MLADALSERLRRALPADQAYTPADWNVDALPGPVDHYLRHLLRHQQGREEYRLRQARTDWVNYDHPDLEQATRAFLDATADHMQVPRDEWAETLQIAIRRTADHLVRPVPTLRAFVFEDPTEPVPASTVEWRMQFFKPYDYLRNAVAAYVEKRNQDVFEPDEFEQLLRRVDERMTDDFDPERWLRLLAPFFETAECATGKRQIPLSLLRPFFEEKNASRVTDRLTAFEHEQNADAVAPTTLRRLLDTTSDSTSAASSPPNASSLPTDLSDPANASSSAAPSSAEDAERSSAKTGGATPMWKQFEQQHSRRSTEVQDENDDASQPLWTQFQSQPSSSPSKSSPESTSSAPEATPDSTPDTPLSALEREVFGAEHPPKRSVYVRELFGGDGEAYRQVLKRLRSIESWSTASQIIASDVFRAHDVNIYSDPAVHFTNAVEAGYKET